MPPGPTVCGGRQNYRKTGKGIFISRKGFGQSVTASPAQGRVEALGGGVLLGLKADARRAPPPLPGPPPSPGGGPPGAAGPYPRKVPAVGRRRKARGCRWPCRKGLGRRTGAADSPAPLRGRPQAGQRGGGRRQKMSARQCLTRRMAAASAMAALRSAAPPLYGAA